MPVSEDRVKNAVVAHIVEQGFSRKLKIRAENQQGVDIYAEHANSAARRVYVEAKGDSDHGNKTLSIQSAWGELISRITALNPNRIHGLAFPSEWETNVARLSSNQVARALNVHFYFVEDSGRVHEYAAAQFERRHHRRRRRRTH